MNTIKRDVYVLRNTIKIPIEVMEGTDMVGFEFAVRDYDIPETAAAVAYAYHRSMKKPNSMLCEITDNVIAFTPESAFFEVGMNELQIRVVNEDKSLISFREKVKCSDAMGFPDDEEEKQQSLVEQLIAYSGKETAERTAADESERQARISADESEKENRITAIENEKNERTAADAKEKSERQAEIDVERKRINNLTKLGEGSTTGDAELQDIRIGADGTRYDTAGEAVRRQSASLKEDLDNIENVGFDVYKSKNIFNPSGVLENSWLLLDGTIQTPSPYGTGTSVYSGVIENGHKLFMTYQNGTTRDIFNVSRYVFENSAGSVIGSGDSTLINDIDIPNGATIFKILFNTASLNNKLQMEYDSVSDYMEYGTKVLSIKNSDIKADATFFSPRRLYAYSGTMRYIDKMNVVASNSDDLMYIESPQNDPSRGKKDKICAIYGVTKIDVKSKITDALLFSKEIGITKVDVTKKANPANPVNIMMIGDSYTGNNILPCDIKKQLVDTYGFTNYHFVGNKSGTDSGVTCNHEGRVGYSVADYLKVNNKDGRGDSFPNPYYSNGKVSIKTYCDTNNIPYPNVFIVELGINDIENGLIGAGVHGTLNERIKYMVDLIHSEFSDAKILLVGVVYASINNGQASYVSKNKNRMEYNQNLESIALSDNYKTFVKYCDVGALFDTVNGYGWTEKVPYRGSDVTEKEISDWLHPCRAGYYMESDCIVPALLDFNIR